MLDLCLPGKESRVEEIESIYSSTRITGGADKPIMQTKTILLLSNDELYPIGKSPDKDYPKGTKIKIIRSAIFNNINKIVVEDNGWKKISVGILSNIILLIIFLVAILISVLNVFFDNKTLNIILIAAMMFLAIISMVNMLYY
jgi:hypothetical protein